MTSAPVPAADTLEKRSTTARIVEVFSSIQGEGPHVGKRHIFVRFFACNLRCLYCDTPESLTGNPPARLEMQPGSGDIHTMQNPLDLGTLAHAITCLAQSPHDAVSLTGGEPLLQPEFLQNLLPQIQGLGLSTYLETNGTLPENLAKIVHLVDIVSMDIKLPQTLGNARDCFAAHQHFLAVAKQAEVFVKLVLPAAPDWDYIRSASNLVAAVDSRIPFILQPLTPCGSLAKAPDAAEIAHAYELCRQVLGDVRVIPQTHKMIGIR